MKIYIATLALFLSACASHQARNPSTAEFQPQNDMQKRMVEIIKSPKATEIVTAFANAVTSNGIRPPFWQLNLHSNEEVNRLSHIQAQLNREANKEASQLINSLEALGLSIRPNHSEHTSPWEIINTRCDEFTDECNVRVMVTPEISWIYIFVRDGQSLKLRESVYYYLAALPPAPKTKKAPKY